MPLFPSPEPTISCIDDLDFFKDFENEFPAIVYNDALTSKLDFSTKPTLYPQHIDEFDLKDETSLFEYDEEEQNVLYFNDLFPFNIIYPDVLKSDKGNDDNKIDMIQSLGGNENTNKLLEESHDKIRKVFIMGSFIMGLNVNIVTWNRFVNGMLYNLIKNLYVPFGIPFDPKRYYKDGDCARMLQRPRYGSPVAFPALACLRALTEHVSVHGTPVAGGPSLFVSQPGENTWSLRRSFSSGMKPGGPSVVCLLPFLAVFCTTESAGDVDVLLSIPHAIFFTLFGWATGFPCRELGVSPRPSSSPLRPIGLESIMDSSAGLKNPEGSDKDYELNLSMYRKAAKLEKQMNAKLAWIHEKYNHRSETHIGGSSSQTHEIGDVYLTAEELHQLHLDEEALRETLEEQTMDEKAREEKIRQKQADDDEYFMEFGVMRIDSDYESSD
ncbi:hypothetical protein Tco_0978817 [Tanacetum coccineum]|uniref:Uncharacterized protein n=1 Tax=Tanacetum coccineum TaxID=301880 RepID=A0ABQ5EP11_9ASTR